MTYPNRREADAVFCPLRPPGFTSVGEWYDDFAPTTDDGGAALAYIGTCARDTSMTTRLTSPSFARSMSAMTWEQILDDPSLRELPFKIEQDRFGRIVMSPLTYGHSRRQALIAARLDRLMPVWETAVECAVETAEGTRVPDVASISAARVRPLGQPPRLPIAPEICVEVLSESNTADEIAEKRLLLAARGCREFWTCSEQGEMAFLDAGTGVPLPRSVLCPDFPGRIGPG
ncbi:MAG: Uma2 family endonuclease [Opitutaceae bacterium]